MELLHAVWSEMSYAVLLVIFVSLAALLAGFLKLLDLIDRIKKKIKEAEK